MSEDTQQSESVTEEEPFDPDEFIVFLEESRLKSAASFADSSSLAISNAR